MWKDSNSSKQVTIYLISYLLSFLSALFQCVQLCILISNNTPRSDSAGYMLPGETKPDNSIDAYYNFVMNFNTYWHRMSTTLITAQQF